MLNGYYDMTFGETKVEVLDNGDYVVSREDALKLPIGSLFTASNGQWYVKVGDNDYRRWTWT
jgi:hypothetical protein